MTVTHFMEQFRLITNELFSNSSSVFRAGSYKINPMRGAKPMVEGVNPVEGVLIDRFTLKPLAQAFC